MTLQKATLAGGCFWCMEHLFYRERGIHSVRSGYVGAKREAIEIVFDPEKISFAQILDLFWRHIDPLDDGGQFADRGYQYQTAIYYHDEAQKKIATKSKAKIQSLFGEAIATEILPATPFTLAEAHHQRYCVKNKSAFERFERGHEPRLREVWEGKELPTEELKEVLTPLQYKVTQEEGTEPPFENDYWNHDEEGIYVDVITGEPLFSSKDKFKSKSGWPSFTKPIDRECVTEHDDWKLGVHRREVKSRSSGAHLGHVFEDGPEPTGLRYCINSAALRFVPKKE